MKKRAKRICLILLASITLSLALTGCDLPMAVLGDLPDPQPCVTGFFDSVCQGDTESADTYLDGVSLTMKNEVTDAFATELLSGLQKSYRYQLTGEPVINRLTATQEVSFTYLDFTLMADDLRAQSTAIGRQKIAEMAPEYTQVDNTLVSLTDDGAKLVALDALHILMNEPEKYYSTKTFSVDMKYHHKAWHIIIGNDLYEAISGAYTPAE